MRLLCDSSQLVDVSRTKSTDEVMKMFPAPTSGDASPPATYPTAPKNADAKPAFSRSASMAEPNNGQRSCLDFA